MGVFTQALQNIATLRADNGASMSRLDSHLIMLQPPRQIWKQPTVGL